MVDNSFSFAENVSSTPTRTLGGLLENENVWRNIRLAFFAAISVTLCRVVYIFVNDNDISSLNGCLNIA